MACEPGTLIDDAKCFLCLDKHNLRALLVYLICSWPDTDSSFRITELSDVRITEAGDRRVIE